MDESNKKRTPEPPVWDPFRALSFVFFSAVGTSTFVFAPLPVLLAHWRLPEPWPKLAVLAGSAMAVLFLGTPVPWAAVAFAVGLVFSDRIARDASVWRALAIASATGTGLALLLFFFYVQQQGAEPWAYWTQLVQTTIAQAQASVDAGVATMDWAALETVIREQAVFFVASLSVIAAWVSLGAAVHFGWSSPERPLTSGILRDKIRLPSWVSLVLGAGLMAGLVYPLPFYLAGPLKLGAAVLFVQGCGVLSDVLNRRGVPRLGRSLVYLVSLLFGFYALLALGMVSPWVRAARGLVPGAVLDERKA